jgi:hypothetical protein
VKDTADFDELSRVVPALPGLLNSAKGRGVVVSGLLERLIGTAGTIATLVDDLLTFWDAGAGGGCAG